MSAAGGFAVLDGAFARWPVRRFSAALIPPEFRARAVAEYSGSPLGLLRGKGNLVATGATVRFPKNSSFPGLDGRAELSYTEQDFALCTDPAWIRDWMQWQACTSLLLRLTNGAQIFTNTIRLRCPAADGHDTCQSLRG
jgi:hypothetical protein